MAPSRVVPTFDVSEQRDPRRGLSLETAAIDKLAFEAGKEALGHRVVVSIADATCRRADAHLQAALAERDTGVLP